MPRKRICNDRTYECGRTDGIIASITDWRLETKTSKWRGGIWNPNILRDLGGVCRRMTYNKAAGSPYRLTNIPDGTIIWGIDVVGGCGSCEKGKVGNVLQDRDESGHNMDTWLCRYSSRVNI